MSWLAPRVAANDLEPPAPVCDDGDFEDFAGCSSLCQHEPPGDIGGDVDVDRTDAAILVGFRGRPLAAFPQRDVDQDGAITVLDGRRLTLLRTRPRCATL